MHRSRRRFAGRLCPSCLPRWARAALAFLALLLSYSLAERYLAMRQPDTLPLVRNVENMGHRKLLEGIEPNAMGASEKLLPGEKKQVLRNTADNYDVQLVTLYLYALPTGEQVVAGAGAPGLAGTFFSNSSRVLFEVKWGVGGSTPFVALVSAKQGTAITLAASSVTVSALYNEASGVSAPEITVGAALSYGPRPPGGAYEPASFDVRISDLPANDRQNLMVPPFARLVTVMSSDSVQGVALTKLSFSGGFPPVTIAEVEGVANQKVLSAPVPDGASQLELTNNEVTPLSFIVIWSLGI